MKILSSLETQQKPLGTSRKKNSSKTGSFSRLLREQETGDILVEELFAHPDKILENVFLLSEELERAGTELAEQPTPEHFARYKKYIGLVIKSALKNMEVEIKTAQRLRRITEYKTVQEIDTVLGDLARRILADEKNRVDILNLTNHLKGLILSLLA